MTVIDFVVIGVVLLSLAVGAWRGMVSEILALVAWVVAFLAARTWATPAGGWLATGLADPLAEPLTQQVAGFVAIFVAVLILFALA
ncbi:MAG: CvpA family protein, partial [Rhodocyclaceae bacterium]|nr:CvpA family protein [Rhodocyclaceae bacterium]